MKTISIRLPIFIKSFACLFPVLLAASFASFYFVLYLLRGAVFGLDDSPIWVEFIFRGMNFREILETPMIYLSSIAFVSALVGAFWTGFVVTKFSQWIWLQILILPWIAVILTGPIWGLIWSINHWPASGFHDYETMMLFRRTDIETGLSISWLAALQSYPLNIFSYALYCGLLVINKKIILQNKDKT